IEWPVSRERIVGRDNYVAVNREDPEGWPIHVLRIVAEDDQVVSEVEVPHSGLGIFRVASFWTVTDNRIVHGIEYWTTTGADQAPQWRARFVERYWPRRLAASAGRIKASRAWKCHPSRDLKWVCHPCTGSRERGRAWRGLARPPRALGRKVRSAAAQAAEVAAR